MLVLVTGEIGCGKTTVCQWVVDLLCIQGVRPGGILTPPRLSATGAKVGIDALDVVTGERRPLAEYVPGGGATIGNYTFCRDTLDWAIACMQAAIAARCPLLVVDEIGSLELVRQGGFVAVLRPLADVDRVLHAIVVVRHEYVDVLDRLLLRPDVQRVYVDEVQRDRLPAHIATDLAQLVFGQ